jgi:hypothetical protein
LDEKIHLTANGEFPIHQGGGDSAGNSKLRLCCLDTFVLASNITDARALHLPKQPPQITSTDEWSSCCHMASDGVEFAQMPSKVHVDGGDCVEKPA